MTAETCTPLPTGVTQRLDGTPTTAEGGPTRPLLCDRARALATLASTQPDTAVVAGFSCIVCRKRGTVSRPAQR